MDYMSKSLDQRLILSLMVALNICSRSIENFTEFRM